MAKTPEQILKNYSEAVRLVNPTKFDFLLEEIPKIIRIRTRLGNGLNGKLKELSPLYKIRRGNMELSSETTNNRSNLTLTGEMLYSIVGNRKGNLFTFFFGNKFAEDKARWAKETGREFFGLKASEKNGLQRRLSAIIREELRKIFKS